MSKSNQTTLKPSNDPDLAPIEDIISAISRGELVIMVDDEDRENEGDLIMAAQFATPEKIAFIVRHTSGVIVAPLTGERCDDLRLPLMVDNNTESHRTAFTISVDLLEGTTTGISAADRAATLRALADPKIAHSAFARPGHIFRCALAKVAYSSARVIPKHQLISLALQVASLQALFAKFKTMMARCLVCQSSKNLLSNMAY